MRSLIDRVFGVSVETRLIVVSVTLHNTRNLMTELGIAIQAAEHIKGCIEQIDFVRGDKGSQREWIILDLCYGPSVLLRRSMNWQVYSDKLRLMEAYYLVCWLLVASFCHVRP